MKKTVAVLFGGQSSEHEVSCMSARTIAEAIDPEKYTVLLIGITKKGEWLYVDCIDQIVDGTWENSTRRAIILPDAGLKSVMVFERNELKESITSSILPVDLVFPDRKSVV